MTRTRHIQIRLTPEEKAAIEAKAFRMNLTVSELIRQELCGTPAKRIHPPATPNGVPVDQSALDALTKKLSLTMPGATARRVAQREIQG